MSQIFKGRFVLFDITLHFYKSFQRPSEITKMGSGIVLRNQNDFLILNMPIDAAKTFKLWTLIFERIYSYLMQQGYKVGKEL
jgi:hypothetical protein